MPNVSPEQIAAARQIDLISFLSQVNPGRLVQVSSHEYCLQDHDSLRISTNGKWNWFSQGFGGASALDFLVKVEGIDFVTAVNVLLACKCIPSIDSAFQKVSTNTKTRIFALPHRSENFSNMRAYLLGRGIDNDVLHDCYDAGIVYQTERKGHSNCVFVGQDESGAARHACIRGCNENFRGDIAGSDKAYTFCVRPTQQSDTLEVYEAPIDAMSGATLHRHYATDHPWRDRYYLAMCGLSYVPVRHLLEATPCIRMVNLCLDSDEAGRQFTENLKSILAEYTVKVVDSPAPKGKDYNEYLQMINKQNKEDINGTKTKSDEDHGHR